MNLLDILGRIGFDWQVALANLINFLIIYWILSRYAFKPIQAIIEKRQQAITEGLGQAKAAETELMMAKQKAEGIVSEAKQEANSLVASAKERGDVLVEEAQKRAHQEEERIILDGSKRVAEERAQAEASLQKQAAVLVATGVRNILGESMSKEQDESITKQSIKAVS